MEYYFIYAILFPGLTFQFTVITDITYGIDFALLMMQLYLVAHLQHI
jgi:hypothetical protein